MMLQCLERSLNFKVCRTLSLTLAANLLSLLPINLWLPLMPEAAAASSSSKSQSEQNKSDITSIQLRADKPLLPSCANYPNSFVPFTKYVNYFVEMSNLAGSVENSMNMLVGNLGNELMAYLNASPGSDINEQARLAKVPIIMYHDVMAKKEVFFDLTPEELEQHLQLIKKNGLTPISMDQLVNHLKNGLPLPEKPILLTFDDGYGGHYKYVYPLLKKYGYPGLFAIYTLNVGKNTGRSHVTWDQLREMAANPLVTISSHSVTHPHDLTVFSDDQLWREVEESKQILEAKLGIPIRYFTYPEGKHDARAEKFVQAAGYKAALTMNDLDDRFAGQSKNLLAIDRIGQSKLQYAISQAWGGSNPIISSPGFNFTSELKVTKKEIDKIHLTLISGGRPITIHAKTRARLTNILAGTNAVAAVDGGFFSLKDLNTNVLIGPVLSQSHTKFIPGNIWENSRIEGRPLVLISPQGVKFIPFDPKKHNTLEGIQAEMPNVTDAFVAAGWLVKNNQPRTLSSFGNLYSVNEARNRAYWGLNQAGEPTIGVTDELVGAVDLGVILAKAGFSEAVMLDSGASTSLAYKGQSLTLYEPRPVPHAVALMPPSKATETKCEVASK